MFKPILHLNVTCLCIIKFRIIDLTLVCATRKINLIEILCNARRSLFKHLILIIFEPPEVTSYHDIDIVRHYRVWSIPVGPFVWSQHINIIEPRCDGGLWPGVGY